MGRILQHAEEIMDLDVAELVDEHDNILPIRKMPAHVRRAIAAFEKDGKGGVKVRLCDRMTALRLLGQHERLWNESPGFIPPAGTAPVTAQQFNFNFLKATQEEALAAYQAMIRHSQQRARERYEAERQLKKLPRSARGVCDSSARTAMTNASVTVHCVRPCGAERNASMPPSLYQAAHR